MFPEPSSDVPYRLGADVGLRGEPAVLGILGLVVVGASAAGASPDDWWFGRSRVMVRGAAASESPGGNYGLGIYARDDGAPKRPGARSVSAKTPEATMATAVKCAA